MRGKRKFGKGWNLKLPVKQMGSNRPKRMSGENESYRQKKMQSSC